MRVLLVQESSWIDRGPHQQHHLMERLQCKGHTIRIIDFDIDWKNSQQRSLYSKRMIFSAEGKSQGQIIEVVRPGMVRIPYLTYFFLILFHLVEILRQIISFKPDVVVGLGLLNSNIAARLCRVFSLSFVYYLIDSLPTLIQENWLKPLGVAVEKRNIMIADRVLVINKALADYVRRLYSRKTPEVVSAGIDTSKFNPQVSGLEIRSKLGYNERDFVLFFMGWIYKFSGLIEVAAELEKENSNLHLLVVGKGDMYSSLEKLSKRNDHIQILQWVPYESIPEYIAAADVCILPAHRNDVMNHIVPIKMYEYLGCGKPVIATKLPGLVREFGSNSGLIYISTPEETVDVADSLAKSRRFYLAQQSNAVRIASTFNWTEITDRFERILQEELMKKKRESQSFHSFPRK